MCKYDRLWSTNGQANISILDLLESDSPQDRESQAIPSPAYSDSCYIACLQHLWTLNRSQPQVTSHPRPCPCPSEHSQVRELLRTYWATCEALSRSAWYEVPEKCLNSEVHINSPVVQPWLTMWPNSEITVHSAGEPVGGVTPCSVEQFLQCNICIRCPAP